MDWQKFKDIFTWLCWTILQVFLLLQPSSLISNFVDFSGREGVRSMLQNVMEWFNLKLFWNHGCYDVVRLRRIYSLILLTLMFFFALICNYSHHPKSMGSFCLLTLHCEAITQIPSLFWNGVFHSALKCVHLHTRTHSDLFKIRTILSPLYFRPSLANWILWAQLVLSGWFAVDCVSISSPVKTSAPSITGKQVSSCILTAVPLSSSFLPLLWSLHRCTMYFIVISDLHVNQLIAADTIV